MTEDKGRVIEGEFRELREEEYSPSPVVRVIIPGRRGLLGRRKLLRAAGTALAGLSTLGIVTSYRGAKLLFPDPLEGSKSSKDTIKSVIKRAAIPELTPIPTLSPENTVTPAPVPTDTPMSTSTPISVSEALQRTATAIAKEGRTDSFKEEGGFTKEMFEKAKKGTYMIEMIGNNVLPTPDAKGIITVELSRATAWLAEVDEKAAYFVTNYHVATVYKHIAGVNFWRPNIDSDKQNFHPGKLIYVLDQMRDLAVIRCEGETNLPKKEDALLWEDESSLKEGDSLMAVGYPVEFEKPGSDMKTATQGLVITLTQSPDDKSHEGLAHGMSGGGGSGSPVITKSTEGIKVVGVLYGSSAIARENNPREPHVAFHTLNVNNLIKIAKIK